MKHGKMIAEVLLGAVSFGAVVAHVESRHRDSIRRTDEARAKNEELAQELSRRQAEDELLRTELVSAKTELAALKSKPTPAEIYQHADWLAHIVTESHEKPLLPILPVYPQTRLGTGSLIRFNGELYVLSANHVQRDKETDVIDSIAVLIKLPGSIPHSAELYGWDPDLDLVLLKFTDGFVYNGPVGELQDSADLTPMTPVIALGSPMKLPFSATYGYIANTKTLGIHNMDIINERLYESGVPEELMHTAPLIAGHSGGPLIDASTGKIIGVNKQIIWNDVDDPASRLYIATPSEDILRVLPKLARGGRVKHGWIPGLVIRDSHAIATPNFPKGKRFITEGAVITETHLAELGGQVFKPTDLILQVEGTQILSPIDFTREIMHREPGEKINIKIIRDGQPTEVTLTLEEYKKK